MRDEDRAGSLTGQDTTTNYRTGSDGYIHSYDRATGRDMGMTWQEQERYDREHRQEEDSNVWETTEATAFGAAAGSIGAFAETAFSLAGTIAGAGIVGSFVLSCIFVIITDVALRDSAAFWRRLFSWRIGSVFSLLIVIAAGILCLRSIARSGRAYKGVFAAAITLAYIIVNHFDGDIIILSAICGLFTSIIPVIILGFIEHVATKDQRGDSRWYITRVSEAIIGGNESVRRSFSMIGTAFIVGGIIFFLGILFVGVQASYVVMCLLVIGAGILNKVVAFLGMC